MSDPGSNKASRLRQLERVLARNKWLEQELKKYQDLYQATRDTFFGLKGRDLSDQVLVAAMELTEADQGSYLIRCLGKEMFVSAHRHRDDDSVRLDSVDATPTLDEHSRRALEKKEIISVSCRDAVLKSITGKFVFSSVFVPLRYHEVEGLIRLDKTEENTVFTERHCGLLKLFSQVAAISLENSLLIHELRLSNEVSAGLVSRLRAAQRITSTLRLSNNLGEIMNNVLDTMIEVFGFDYAAISLIDQKVGLISTEYAKSRDPELVPVNWISISKYSLDDNDIIAFTAREKKEQIVSGWDERLNEKIYHQYGHENLVRMYVPVLDRFGNSMAVIEVGYHKESAPNADFRDEKDLGLFVIQIGVAIENLEVLNKSKEHSLLQARSEQLRRIGLIAQQMFSELESPQRVLQTIADETRVLLRADYVNVLPLSKEGAFIKEWVTVSPSNVAQSKSGRPLPDGLTDRTLTQGIIEVLDTNASYPFATRPRFVVDHAIQSFVAAPMQLPNDDVGIIIVNYCTKQRLNIEEKDLLKDLAGLAAGAIRNAHILASEHQRVEVLNGLVALSKRLGTSGAQGLGPTVQNIIEGISELIPNDHCSVWLIDPTNTDILYPIAAGGKHAEEVSTMDLKVGEGIVGEVAETRTAIAAQDARAYPGAVHIPNTPLNEDQAIIAVPILFQEDLLGVLTVSRYALGKFDMEQDLPLMYLLSEMASAAIEIASLMSELIERQEILDREFLDTFEDRGERYAGMFFYDTIAHDIRNVLNIINSQLNNLETNEQFMRKLSSAARSRFGSVKYRTEQAAETIGAYLDLARTATSERKEQDPNRVVNRAISLMQPRFDDNEVEVVFSRTPDLPFVTVNLFRMVEVLLNLLSNALKSVESMPRNRRSITLITTVTEDKKWVKIQVADTGVGIKAENKGKIFTPSYSWWPSREKTGYGIGLYVSKMIVERHGGKLSFESTYGKGSTFTMLLPNAEEE